MRKWLNWLFDHGVGLAYGVLVSLSLAVASVVLMSVVAFAKLLDKIR
jgi:hypothetical protein